MKNKIQLSQQEFNLLESSLEETITVLNNRFIQVDGFVHPSKKYEDLYDKLTKWSEPLPVSIYTLSAKIKEN